jgi:hypothetical protein
MSRARPGWLVAVCALVVAVSAWLPWLTSASTPAGRGRANAIGGVSGAMPVPPPGFGVGQLIVLLSAVLVVAGAMAARGISTRLASTAALAVSVILVVLAVWFYRLYVYPPVTAGYGLFVAGGAGLAAMLLSVWTMLAGWKGATSPARVA